MCTTTCGGGAMSRFRNCSDPVPMHGGKGCERIGAAFDVKSCGDSYCPGMLMIHRLVFCLFDICSFTFPCTRTRNLSRLSPQNLLSSSRDFYLALICLGPPHLSVLSFRKSSSFFCIDHISAASGLISSQLKNLTTIAILRNPLQAHALGFG